MGYLKRIQASLLKYIWVILLLLSLGYFYKQNMYFNSMLELRLWLANFGSLAPLAYILLYTLRPVLLIPALLLNLVAAVLFGPIWGIIYILMGGLGSASLCYYLAKHTNFEFVNRVAKKWWGFVDRYSPKSDFKKMLCLRIVPIFPYDPISFLAGLSNIPYKTYALATLIGMLPGAIAYNFLTDSFLSPNTSKSLAIITCLVAFVLPYIYWQQKIKIRN